MILPLLRSAFATAFRSIAREPLAPALGVATVALGLAATSFLALVAVRLMQISRDGAPEAEMIIELDDGFGPSRAEDLARRIGKLERVAQVKRVSSADAIARLKAGLGSEANAIEGIEPDFLPSLLEVTFRAGTAAATTTSALAERLEHMPGVTRVVYAGDWVDRLRRILGIASTVMWTALILVAAAALYVVGATSRLRALGRSDEIAILKLVGATNRFVRAPFLIEGAVVGILGAAFGIALLYGVLAWLEPVLRSAPQTVLPSRISLDPRLLLTPRTCLQTALACAALCALTSALTVRKHTRV